MSFSYKKIIEFLIFFQKKSGFCKYRDKQLYPITEMFSVMFNRGFMNYRKSKITNKRKSVEKSHVSIKMGPFSYKKNHVKYGDLPYQRNKVEKKKTRGVFSILKLFSCLFGDVLNLSNCILTIIQYLDNMLGH